MIRSGALISLLLLISPIPAWSAESNGMAAESTNAVSDAYQADISLHRSNWKASMDKAVDYVKNGDYATAQKMTDIARREACAIDSSGSSVAETEKMAGDIAMAQNNLTAAERCYRRSVYLYDRAESPDKSEFAAALTSYANLLKRENRVREASRFEMQANSLRRDDKATAEANRSL
ncbi:MAG TPA: hypothetical protein V6C89_01790 [Drouetiella sp.]|jgi:tetratricopeptide (TPR) repeat protein